MSPLPTIRNIKNLQGLRVLVRADFNVPITDGSVALSDRARLRAALPTLKFLSEGGARIVVISHIGRDPKESLRPVHAALQEEGLVIGFSPSVGTDESRVMAGNLKNGEMILLENLRQDAREESNDPIFSEFLASLCDIYINDAFSASHRTHASIVGVLSLRPAYIGIQFERELNGLGQALEPVHPAIAIIGGAKFDTKLPVIQSILPKVDHVFIVGALAHRFFLEQGKNIGASLVDRESDISSILGNPKIHVPRNLAVVREGVTIECTIDDVTSDDVIVDNDIALPENTPLFENAKTIIWNGPLGNYENGFDKGTRRCAEMISATGAQTIVGGGDTVVILERYDLANSMTFVSMAGGAMLDYLAAGTLPGIEAIEKAQKI